MHPRSDDHAHAHAMVRASTALSRRRLLLLGATALVASPYMFPASADALPAVLTRTGELARAGATKFKSVLSADLIKDRVLDSVLNDLDGGGQIYGRTNALLAPHSTTTSDAFEVFAKQTLGPWPPGLADLSWQNPPMMAFVPNSQGTSGFVPVVQYDLARQGIYGVDTRLLLQTASSPSTDAFELQAASTGQSVAIGMEQQGVFTVPILNGQTIRGLGDAAEWWYNQDLYSQYGVTAEDALVPHLTMSHGSLGTPWSRSYTSWQAYTTANGYVSVNYQVPSPASGIGVITVHVRGSDRSLMLSREWRVAWG